MKRLLLVWLGIAASAWAQIVPTSNVRSLLNIAQLRAFGVAGVTSGQLIQTQGYYAANDGGGGSYVWNPNSTVADNGGTIIEPNGITTGRWVLQYVGAISVRYFGAKGDGSTDDHSAINNAISFAQSSGSGVLVPSGTFVCNSDLLVTGSVALSGIGPSSVLNFNTSDEGIYVTASSVSISNLTITGSASRMIRASLTSGTGLTIRNCDISGATVNPAVLMLAGIYIDGFSKTTVDGCYVHGCGQSGSPRGFSIVFNFGTSAISTGNTVNNCRVETTNAAFGIGLFNCSQSKVSGNQVDGSTLDATSASGYGILIYATGSGLTRNTVVNNTVTNTQGSGIYFNTSDDSVCDDNLCYNTAQSQTDGSLPVGGLAFNICSRLTCSGNHVATSGKDGICLVGTDAAITGNEIYSVSQNGINLRTTATGHDITGNRVVSANIGINANSVTASNLTVTGNSFSGCVYGGVFCSTLNSSIIVGNGFTSEPRGIQVLAGVSDLFSGNLFQTISLDGIEFRGTNSKLVYNQMDSVTTGIDVSSGSGNFVRDTPFTNGTTLLLTGGNNVAVTVTSNNPHAAAGDILTLTYGTPTNVTALQDGMIGDERTLIAGDGDCTLKYGASTLILAGGVDFAMSTGNSVTLKKITSTAWIEVGRKQ